MPVGHVRKAEPAWKLAERFPWQGQWSEFEYLALDNVVENQRTIELVDGRLEFLEFQKIRDARIVKYLFNSLWEFGRKVRIGEVFFAGRKVKLRKNLIRLPDIVVACRTSSRRSTEEYEIGADLLIEVLGKGSDERRRDLITKRREYAQGGVREYWIVDPHRQQIIVLALRGSAYKQHGRFKPGEKATSVLLKGFEVYVTEALAGLKK